MTRRVGLLAAVLSLLPACPFCDDVEQFLPQGSICIDEGEDCGGALRDLGAVTSGATCSAKLFVKNRGNADLELVAGSAKLVDTDGDFTLKKVPPLVRLGATEEVVIEYVAGDAIGEREGTGFEMQTNDPDDDGFLRGSVSAFVAAAPVPLATSACAKEDDAGETVTETPCETLDFGAVPTSNPAEPIEQRAGATRTIQIVNNGNADLTVSAAVVDGGNGDFAVSSVRRGSQVFTLPVVVPAGVSGDCGEPSGADNVLSIDVRFAPTNLGAGIATLQVVTDGAEGALIEVALSGVGADTGILTTPDILRFANIDAGASDTQVVLVQNVGTSSAAVNTSCIDVEDDGTCDADCTGAAGDTALGGTLRCEVKRSDGSHEGEGFLLDPTDAAAGGNDERTIAVTWSPSAEEPAIPTSAVLALKSNIQNDKVFKVGLVGGAAGVLAVDSDNPCADAHCVQAVGDPDASPPDWTGTLTLTLTNTGTAPLHIQSIAAEAGTPATIVDDWTIGAPGTDTLAPDASTTVTLTYANSADDFSGVDGFNLIIDHDGVLGGTLVSILVVPPQ